MNFAQLFRSYMDGLTLDEVAQACAARGVRLDPTYISKLRTGGRPAPDDDDTVRLLAEVCNRDPDPLLFLARLERQPRKAMRMILDVAQEARAAFKALALHSAMSLVDVRKQAEAGWSASRIVEFLQSDHKVRTLWDKAHTHDNALHRYAEYLYDADTEERVGQALQESTGIDLPIQRPVDLLIEELAQATDVPPDILADMVSTLKRAASRSRQGSQAPLEPQARPMPEVESSTDQSATGAEETGSTEPTVDLTWITPKPDYDDRPPYVAPRNRMEECLATVLKARFGLKDLGVFDNVPRLAGVSTLTVASALYDLRNFGIYFHSLDRTSASVAEYAGQATLLPGYKFPNPGDMSGAK